MPDDIGDHRFYLAGAAAILSEYPQEVRTMISDPRTGTRLLKPFPSLHDLRQACDKAYEPIEREMERELAARRANETLKLIGPERRKRSPEEQARVDEQVKAARGRLGIPEGGLTRRDPVLPPSADAPHRSHVSSAPDGKHGERVKADLDMRRTRREVQADTG
jgi:hypothetical protein